MFVTVEFKSYKGWEIFREYFDMPADNFEILFASIRRELQDPEMELRVWFERTKPRD